MCLRNRISAAPGILVLAIFVVRSPVYHAANTRDDAVGKHLLSASVFCVPEMIGLNDDKAVRRK